MKPLQADLRVDSLVLYAPNAFIVDQVRELYLARIRELLAHFAGFSDVFLKSARAPPVEAQNAPVSTPSAHVSSEPQVPFAGNLDSHYTFANFVEGRSNQLAWPPPSRQRRSRATGRTTRCCCTEARAWARPT